MRGHSLAYLGLLRGMLSRGGASTIMDSPLPCVWMRAGVLNYWLCDRQYECADCPLDLAMRRSSPPATHSGRRETEGRASPPGHVVSGYDLPEGVFYAPWHSWARIEGGGRVRVGLDDFAQRLLGRICAVDLPAPGTKVGPRARTWRVANVAGVITIPFPMSGVVREVSEGVVTEPAVINRDPYGRGAAFVIEPTRLAEGVRRLFYGEEARRWCGAEAIRLREELAARGAQSAATGPTLQDGGIPVSELTSVLGPADFRALVLSFLSEKSPSSGPPTGPPRGAEPRAYGESR